jgi:hypothetical protein
VARHCGDTKLSLVPEQPLGRSWLSTSQTSAITEDQALKACGTIDKSTFILEKGSFFFKYAHARSFA